MSWMQDPVEFAKRFEAAGFNIVAMSEAEGSNPGTLRKYRRMHGIEYPAHINPKGNHRPIVAAVDTPPLVPIEEDELRIEGDAALSSDWHVPIIDWDVFHRWLDDAHRANLTTGICAGDMFNFDAWSRHDHKQKGTSPNDDMNAGAYAVTQALEVFDRLVVTRGNHDENLHRKLDYGIKFDRVLRMALEGVPREKLDRLVITGRDYVIIDTDEGEWRVCHTRSYSKQPLAYPNRISMRYEQHVAGGHRHHHAQGWSSAGRRLVELGGFMDEERMAYTKRYTNDFPIMQKGYALLIGGRADCPMLRE
jgi:hypothetical protein